METGEPGLYGEASSALRAAPNNSGSLATFAAMHGASVKCQTVPMQCLGFDKLVLNLTEQLGLLV
jgi:hypothetical protein